MNAYVWCLWLLHFHCWSVVIKEVTGDTGQVKCFVMIIQEDLVHLYIEVILFISKGLVNLCPGDALVKVGR